MQSERQKFWAPKNSGRKKDGAQNASYFTEYFLKNKTSSQERSSSDLFAYVELNLLSWIVDAPYYSMPKRLMAENFPAVHKRR